MFVQRVSIDLNALIRWNSYFIHYYIHLFPIKTVLLAEDMAVLGNCMDDVGVQLGEPGKHRVPYAVAFNGFVGVGAVDDEGYPMLMGILPDFVSGEL